MYIALGSGTLEMMSKMQKATVFRKNVLSLTYFRAGLSWYVDGEVEMR